MISQTKVRLNTKLSNVEIVSVKHDGVTQLIEGAPFKRVGDNVMAAPVGAATAAAVPAPDVLYINFVPTDRSDVSGIARNGFREELATYSITGGGLAGILGANTDVGLPASCWEGGALPLIGEGVFMGPSGLLASEPMVAGSRYYGIVERYEDSAAFFLFSSRPFTA